jgi:competence protein ComEA
MNNLYRTLLACLLFACASFSFADTVTDNIQSARTDEVINRIDINNADIKTLTSLKGIGKKKATAIIEYRNVNGNFTTIEELVNVEGIGKQVLLMNKEKLTI